MLKAWKHYIAVVRNYFFGNDKPKPIRTKFYVDTSPRMARSPTDLWRPPPNRHKWRGKPYFPKFLSVKQRMLPGTPFLTIFSSHFTGLIKVQERIEYKIIFIMYKLLQSSSPHYLHDLITFQLSQSTQSSALVTLLQQSVDSSLKITDHSAPSVCCTSLVEQASSYSSCFLSVRSFIITQLFSIVILDAALVDLSCGVFHSRLKTSFPSIIVTRLSLFRLISWNYDRCSAVTGSDRR